MTRDLRSESRMALSVSFAASPLSLAEAVQYDRTKPVNPEHALILGCAGTRSW